MNKLFVFILCLLSVACADKKKQNNTPILGDEVVTFIVKNVPDAHNFEDNIYISGDFEGWSGGREQFKLKKRGRTYSIDIPKYQETISFKFTKGKWGNEECKSNGNPVENRTYNFDSSKDTVFIKIANWSSGTDQQKVSTTSDNVQVFAENFKIPQLNRERKIQVYLPPNYEASKQQYPVLYILDGQNVFDVATSYAGEWEVDETLNRLYEASGFGLIVVAIDHGDELRLNEYSAWDNEEHGRGEGEAFLNFLVQNLKPEIDKNFRTKKDADNTIIMGASLGGLFAHYAVLEKSDVFGKAGVFSPSFWYAKESFDFTKQRAALKDSKAYYLIGGKEGADMVKPMEDMVGLMKANGFSEDNIYSKIVPNGTHSETFWKSEFEEAIKWLFKLK